MLLVQEVSASWVIAGTPESPGHLQRVPGLAPASGDRAGHLGMGRTRGETGWPSAGWMAHSPAICHASALEINEVPEGRDN